MFWSVDASLSNSKFLKKVASVWATFFVSKLLQKREQHQDGLDDAENKHDPLEFVHDITPSLSRGEPTHRLPRRIYHMPRNFSSKKLLANRDGELIFY